MTNSDFPTLPSTEGDTTIVASVGSLPHNFGFGAGATLKDSLDGLHARLAIPARYEVLDELGRGGMGIVYKVRDVETCEIVAIKILKPGIASDPAMRENLRKEVCLARKVTHKNVCRIHEFTRSETTACISMEYVDGESLLSKLHRRGALSVADAVEIAQQICAGLREAHAQGIVHRDLKPANIVIARDRAVKIMDFGVARRTRDAGDQTTGTLAGTPAYMSPEQLEMKPVTASTDIYAVGLVLYEMVTGAPAFSGENAIALALQQIREMPKRPSEIISTIPAKLDAAILKCLEKDPAKRFASVDDLSVTLGRALGPATSPSLPAIDLAKLEPVKIAARTVARAAIADFSLLGKTIKRGAVRMAETARPKAERWIAAVRTHNWHSRLSRKAQGVAFGAMLFATTLVFTFMVRQEIHAEPSSSLRTAVMAAAPPSQSAAPADSSQPAPPTPFDEKEFEFQTTPVAASAGTDVQPDRDAAPSSTMKSQHVPIANARLTRAVFTSTIQKSRSQPRPLSQKIAPTSAVAAVPASNTIASTSPSALSIPVDDGALSSATLLTLQPATARSAPNASAQPQPPLSEPYLEVGSFNDSDWADEAVNRLSRLGFAAFAVHKSRLWIQSYHVEVGPFMTTSGLESAEARLAANGFKSHAVK